MLAHNNLSSRMHLISSMQKMFHVVQQTILQARVGDDRPMCRLAWPSVDRTIPYPSTTPSVDVGVFLELRALPRVAGLRDLAMGVFRRLALLTYMQIGIPVEALIHPRPEVPPREQRVPLGIQPTRAATKATVAIVVRLSLDCCGTNPV